MRLKAGTLYQAWIGAVAFAACSIVAAPASSEEPWGWELPKFSEPVRIIALYRTDDGHPVAHFASKPDLLHPEKPLRLSGLYDVVARKQLATPAEMKSIVNYETEKAVLAKHRLTAMHVRENGQGVGLEPDDFAYSRCEYPYANGVSINHVVYLVLWKRPHPVTKRYGCSYHGNSMSSARLTTRYQDQPWHSWWSDGPDRYFAMTDVPWLIRFDANGQTHFFDHRRDAGLVRAEAIQPLIEKMSTIDGGPPDPRPLFKKVEAIIDAQMKAAH